MKAMNDKAIGNWFRLLKTEALCLPRFQRRQVWKNKNICKFLKTLLLDSETPVGVFLVLSTEPSKPAFPYPRTISNSTPQPGACNLLLLDGQQRLSALWKVFHDGNEDYRYYIQFNDRFEIEDVKAIRKRTKAEEKRNQDPTGQCKRGWFPARLLNPLDDSEKINIWLEQIDLEKLKLSNSRDIFRLISNTRKIFAEESKNKKVIPYFLLRNNIERKKAINIYQTINTNLVKLSDHYLAVAEMEKVTGKSLYDMAGKLIKQVSLIKDLETDEIGELILKISCVLQGKIPSGQSYKKLDFWKVLGDKQEIFEGVAWAVEKLNEINIWDKSLLPSVIPLRVLPALRRDMPPSGRKLADANRIITKYLWHTFLTDRYDTHANDRLKEDCDDLRTYLGGGKKENQISIFNKREYGPPSLSDLKDAGWPQTTNRLPRGILLVCCQDGAKTLESEERLTKQNFKNRQKHHIFPKSKLVHTVGHAGHYALNCMLIPGDDNNNYDNHYPGDYIQQVINQLGTVGAKRRILNLLGTHLISSTLAQDLLMANEKNLTSKKKIKESFDGFMNTRARTVMKKINQLLAG